MRTNEKKKKLEGCEGKEKHYDPLLMSGGRKLIYFFFFL
jgi:hypothetical protein